MDIFGFFSQTLQGADILADASHETHEYRVFMPDMWDNEPADISWYPPVTDEQKEKMGDWWGRKGDFTKGIEKVNKLLQSLKKSNPQITEWVCVGYCWGGKVSALTSGEGTQWAASVECHPAAVDADDARAIKIPHALLASKDEDAKEVKRFESDLTGPHHVETFGSQIHGWMAARSDLDDPVVLKEYERGYKTVLDFLAKHL